MMADNDGTREREDSVLSRILAWASSRPLWQQDALRRIVLDGFPDEQAIHEILALCKKEHGDESVQLTAEPLSKDHLPIDLGKGESVSLASIGNVVGVNQLALGQTLAFSPAGLTIIYGRNGTGKSGYTRILKKACRSRHPGEVMPDVYNPSPSGSATADLRIARADGTVNSVRWENGKEDSEILSAITVFDREAAAVHVQKKNEVWFRPFGLDIPDNLADVCQDIKTRLTSEKENLEAQRNAVFANPPWSSRSAFGKALSALRHDTDLKAIIPDTPFSAEDMARLANLQADLAQAPAVAANAQRVYADQLDQLVSYLDRIEEALKAEKIQTLLEIKRRADDAHEAATKAAHDAFSGHRLEGIGEAVWRNLWESARAYSKAARADGLAFPPSVDDVCVLCHQEINGPTASRMRGFEEFIKKDTATKAADTKHALNEAKRTFAEREIHIRKTSAAYRDLKTRNFELAKKVLRYIAVGRLVKKQTLALLKGRNVQRRLNLPEAVGELVKEESAKVRSYADSLDDVSDGSAREAVLDELADLKDRKRSDEFVEIAQSEIVRLRTLQRVEDCLRETATTAITRLGNQIADDLITPRMHDRFQKEIVKLAGNPARAEVVRSGGKRGSPQYEVKLYASSKAKVHDVLSEGEQTCVALASYLTELANAAHASALVFDDPVSSLDHRWRSRVAKRLVCEAGKRQIIVFTHDMIFVNDLHQLATDADLPVALAHLTRGPDRVGIVNDGLPWTASSIRDRIDKLEKSAHKAKKLFEARNEEDYKAKATSFYSRLRATWERALEDIVFANVIMRHRDYIDTKKLNRVTALEKCDVVTFKSSYKKCCEFVDAHDPSRGRDLELPEPDELMHDIRTLKNWSETLRAKMNAAD